MVSNAVIGLFGFVLAIMFWPGQAGAAEPSRWAFLAVAVPLGLFWVRLRLTTENVLWGLLIAWAAISILWSDVRYDAYDWLISLGILFGCFAIGNAIEDATWFYRGIALGLIVTLPIAIAQWFGYYPVVAVMPSGMSLPSGLFVNPSILGESCAPIIACLMVRKNWADWLLALMVLPLLILSENRSGLIAVVICALIFLVSFGWKRIWLGVLIAPAWLIIHKGLHPWDSVLQRTDLWKGVWAGLTWFGHGIGQFYVDFPLSNGALMSEPSPNWILTAHAHNDALEIAYELGMPGVILVGLLCWCVCCKANRSERYGLAAICITSLVGFPWHMPFTAAVGAIMAGHATRGRDLVRGTELYRRCVLYLGGKQPNYGTAAICGEAISA